MNFPFENQSFSSFFSEESSCFSRRIVISYIEESINVYTPSKCQSYMRSRGLNTISFSRNLVISSTKSITSSDNSSEIARKRGKTWRTMERIWGGYGEDMGRKWGGYGEDMGRIWGGYGEEMGRKWGGYGEDMGRKWGGYGEEMGRTWGNDDHRSPPPRSPVTRSVRYFTRKDHHVQGKNLDFRLMNVQLYMTFICVILLILYNARTRRRCSRSSCQSAALK